MKIVCCVCNVLISTKKTDDPNEDNLVSHSYCQPCADEARKELKIFKKENQNED